jgi:hypothetical protein
MVGYLFTMQSFDLRNFKTVNTILSRDSKGTTYKFALLRGAVEIPRIPAPEAEER